MKYISLLATILLYTTDLDHYADVFPRSTFTDTLALLIPLSIARYWIVNTVISSQPLKNLLVFNLD